MHALWELISPKLLPSELVAHALIKLMIAATLGALIGLERQISRSPAGLRTNMFMCLGSTLFTILSFAYSDGTNDHTRIAAQVVTGIGFIGAGTILRSKVGVTGLTTAATIFVVAAVGMAVGGGEYLIAVYATLIVILGLQVLGRLETRFNLKAVTFEYEVKGKDAVGVMSQVNDALESNHLIMDHVQFATADGHYRVQFSVEALHDRHQVFMQRLQNSDKIDSIVMVDAPSYEG
jgi:putative Mg2+ transporter-C (MgtC) family protein